jgi:predicted nucleic acid-binding protein
MSGAECFIDTNVFIYQLEARDQRKAEIADGIIRRAVETGDACISFQVVQECLSTALRKAEVPLDLAGARTYFETVLAPLYRISPSVALYHRALDLQARHSLSFYDALIVAAALEAGCSKLWSEDMHDGLRIDRLTIRNPFAKRPGK